MLEKKRTEAVNIYVGTLTPEASAALHTVGIAAPDVLVFPDERVAHGNSTKHHKTGIALPASSFLSCRPCFGIGGLELAKKDTELYHPGRGAGLVPGGARGVAGQQGAEGPRPRRHCQCVSDAEKKIADRQLVPMIKGSFRANDRCTSSFLPP